MEPASEKVKYICGDCGAENTLRLGDGGQIECRVCNYRVLYKKRTRRIVEHQAR